jgi:sugar lactone lactonase YvrE
MLLSQVRVGFLIQMIIACNLVYVSDIGNNRIQKFSSDGTFITKWGSLGTADNQFNDARGVAVDRFGNVYVADSGNHRVQTFVPH